MAGMSKRIWSGWTAGRIALGLAGLVFLILFLAWLDGGREPIRPVERTLELPAQDGSD